MIYLAANNSGCWRLREQGFPIGWIMSPEGIKRPMRDGKIMPYALDNGLFYPPGGDPKPEAYCWKIVSICCRVLADGWPAPLFVTCPDVPYDGKASWERSRVWRRVLRGLFGPDQIPLALAVQDGMEKCSPGILDGYEWVFIAGSTEWKERTAAYWADAARARGLKSHLARVNELSRMRVAQLAGVDSADGTGIWRGDRKQKRRVLDALVQLSLYDPSRTVGVGA